jgi:hypothetical protein
MLGGISCIDCCIGAENLYIGGKTLQFFERGPKMYRNIGSSSINSKPTTFSNPNYSPYLLDGDRERFLKVYPDGRFVIRCLKTNSLVLLSPSCKELKTIPGEVYYDHTPEQHDKLKSYENSSGDMIMLWRKSKHTIALVDLKVFKIKKEISNFWTYKEHNLQDCLAICDNNMMNIIGVSQLEDDSRIFHHYTKEGKVVNAQMNSLMPDLNVWHCMSMCMDKSKFFVSGTSSFNKNIGVLFAVFESTVPIKIVTAIKVPKVKTTQKV